MNPKQMDPMDLRSKLLRLQGHLYNYTRGMIAGEDMEDNDALKRIGKYADGLYTGMDDLRPTPEFLRSVYFDILAENYFDTMPTEDGQ